MLEKLNPAISDNLVNLSRTIALDYEFIDLVSRQALQLINRGQSSRQIKLELAGLKKLSAAVRNNVLRLAIEELKGDTRRIESRHVEEMVDLIFQRPCGSVVDLPFLVVRKEEKNFVIQNKTKT
jgi:hypothetical protein